MIALRIDLHRQAEGGIDMAALGLTYTQLTDMMGLIMKDADHKRFPLASKDLMLNMAQNKVVELLEKGLLPELDASDSSKALDASGNYTLSSLTSIVYNTPLGIEKVKISGATGKYCELITHDEYVDLVNINHTFSANAPYAYIRGGTIHVEPNSGISTSIDVYYRKEPTAITSSATSEFNVKVDEILVHYAVSLGFEWEQDFDKSDRWRKTAYEEINKMNNDYLQKIGITDETNITKSEE